MTELQKTFTESYLKELKDAVKSGSNLSSYKGKEFNIDFSRVKPLASVYAPEHLTDKMDPADDFKSAVALYEAYKNITPLLATSEAFWAFLTHTELFTYTQRRWPNIGSNPEYVLEHWFVDGKGIFRNAAASLWWGVRLTVDDSMPDKYVFTKVLFGSAHFRIILFGHGSLIRHHEAMVGILGFLKDNPDLFTNSRCLYLTKYFNRLGGVKQLACLDREFFRNECEKIGETLLKIESRDDLKEMYPNDSL